MPFDSPRPNAAEMICVGSPISILVHSLGLSMQCFLTLLRRATTPCHFGAATKTQSQPKKQTIAHVFDCRRTTPEERHNPTCRPYYWVLKRSLTPAGPCTGCSSLLRPQALILGAESHTIPIIEHDHCHVPPDLCTHLLYCIFRGSKPFCTIIAYSSADTLLKANLRYQASRERAKQQIEFSLAGRKNGSQIDMSHN
jgi:hypothetical protein